MKEYVGNIWRNMCFKEKIKMYSYFSKKSLVVWNCLKWNLEVKWVSETKAVPTKNYVINAKKYATTWRNFYLLRIRICDCSKFLSNNRLVLPNGRQELQWTCQQVTRVHIIFMNFEQATQLDEIGDYSFCGSNRVLEQEFAIIDWGTNLTTMLIKVGGRMFMSSRVVKILW